MSKSRPTARTKKKNNNNQKTLSSDSPWKVETPFGPPPRLPSFPISGMRKIRNTLSKLSLSAWAEKEMLKRKKSRNNNTGVRCRVPLTERNVGNLVSAQEYEEACFPGRHTNEIQVSAWLDRVA